MGKDSFQWRVDMWVRDAVSFQVCSLATTTFLLLGQQLCITDLQTMWMLVQSAEFPPHYQSFWFSWSERWGWELELLTCLFWHLLDSRVLLDTKPFYSLISHFCFSRKLASSYPASSMFSSIPGSFQYLLSALMQFPIDSLPIYLPFVCISYLQLCC